MKTHFPAIEQPVKSPTALDYEEHNAIRYTAGYAIQSKINCCSNPLKVELALCLMREEDGNSLSHASEEWLQAIDLVHMNDMTYMLFRALEEALCPYLGLRESNQLIIKEVSTVMKLDENMLFYWSMSTGKKNLSRFSWVCLLNTG